MKQKPQEANPSEFPEPTREKPQMPGTLPPSTDKNFWGEDADINLIDTRAIPRITPECGDFKQKGRVVYCGTCSNQHTLPGVRLDKSGNLVKL